MRERARNRGFNLGFCPGPRANDGVGREWIFSQALRICRFHETWGGRESASRGRDIREQRVASKQRHGVPTGPLPQEAPSDFPACAYSMEFIFKSMPGGLCTSLRAMNFVQNR